MMPARLSRGLRLKRTRARGAAGPSLDGHVVLLPVGGGDCLDSDLPTGHGPEALEGVTLLRLQVVGHVGMDADQALMACSFVSRGLDLPEDLRRQCRIR